MRPLFLAAALMVSTASFAEDVKQEAPKTDPVMVSIVKKAGENKNNRLYVEGFCDGVKAMNHQDAAVHGWGIPEESLVAPSITFDSKVVFKCKKEK